jgi:hypothetical protein
MKLQKLQKIKKNKCKKKQREGRGHVIQLDITVF